MQSTTKIRLEIQSSTQNLIKEGCEAGPILKRRRSSPHPPRCMLYKNPHEFTIGTLTIGVSRDESHCHSGVICLQSEGHGVGLADKRENGVGDPHSWVICDLSQTPGPASTENV